MHREVANNEYRTIQKPPAGRPAAWHHGLVRVPAALVDSTRASERGSLSTQTQMEGRSKIFWFRRIFTVLLASSQVVGETETARARARVAISQNAERNMHWYRSKRHQLK